jgi:1,6-anhydro-N-acetylmuramate kinase
MGAPLAGFFEAALIRHPTKLRVSQNIGGMGNVTIIPPFSIGKSTYSAFDTGPGNVLIDAAVRILTRGPDVRQYDADGLMGAAGEAEIDQEYIKRYIASVAYFAEQPPKTTGREIFSDDMARSIVSDLQEKGLSDNGIVATVTRITAESIARAYEDFVIPEHGEIDEIYICGGGAENPNLTSFLRQRFPRSTVRKLNDATSPRSMSPEGDGGVGVGGDSLSPEGEAAADLDGFATEAKVGIPAEAKEAVMFALLGFLCVCGRSVPIASNETRAEQAIMGKITPGKNFGAVLRNALDARETKDVLGRIFVK